MSQKLLSVIVINHNTPQLVYDCAGSLQHHLAAHQEQVELIVVDNGSTTLDTETLATHWHGDLLVYQQENLGFGSANNLGAHHASGAYLWILNSDTLLVDDSIFTCIQYLDTNPKVGAITPLLYRDRELTDFQEDSIGYSSRLDRLITRKTRPDFLPSPTMPEVFEVEMACGAALLIRAKLYSQLNGFDEQFFMYFEDEDLCLRLRRLGYRIMLYTKSRLVHLQGRSIAVSSTRKKLYYRSQDYFWQKHFGTAGRLAMQALRAPYRLIRGV